ncbi:aldo-keto reductase family 1 member B1-like [Styela clava]|uniref:aldo-keto reductase family 1 member B1-like n=1 Tax=Styela clava TaxID=7725 RepID=UPI0019393673|nr:aldo-keto reductase family 1 member B1-like [Styela clava]
MSVPNVKLNTGYGMPILGFGTWQSEKGVVGAAVKSALNVGYRHIDCAWVYGNEKEIGDALEETFKEGKIKREDLFLTSKLWNIFHDPEDVEDSLRETLKFLQTDYLDLYLMHWPFSFFKNDNRDILPKDGDDKVMNTYIHYLDTWKAMENCQKKGLVRSIGVSNFNEYQINKIIKGGSIVPAVHQIECHPYLNEETHIKYCKDNGIAVTAYAPLGSPKRPWGTAEEPVVLNDPVLKKIADKYGKTPAHVAIKFQMQRGVIVIPKSVTPARISSNFEVFDFELSNDDMDGIRGVNRNWRGLSFDWAAKSHKYWAYHPNYSED